MPNDNVRFNRIPEEVLERWRVVRDVVAGDQYVRGYLPYLNRSDTTQENIDRNAAYAQRAVWYPATQFTLEGMLGMAFRVDPHIDLPSQLKVWETNCDGAGTSIYQQSQESLSNVVGPGRHALYVDFSASMNGPVIKSYHAENVINWKYKTVDGQEVLTLVVLEERVEVETGDFALETVLQWRELRLEDNKFVVRLWREHEDPDQPPVLTKQKDANGIDQDVLEIRTQGAVWDVIPFTFIGSKRNNGAEIGPSPLYGLARMNLAHYRNSADYEDSVFYTGQAQAWISGLTEQWRDWMVAPFVLGNDGEKVFTGQRLYIGARVIEPGRPGSRTATEDDNDKEASVSVLSMCVSNVNEAYQQCIAWGMRWKGTKDFDADGKFKITQEFIGKKIDATVLTAMVSSWQTGITAKNDVRDYMRQVGLVGSDRDDDTIQEDIDNEGPRPGTVGLDGEPLDGAPADGKPPTDKRPKPPAPSPTPKPKKV